MEALLQITLSFSIYLGLLLCYVTFCCAARAFACFLFGVYSIVDFSISMDAETVIDAPLLDIYVFVFVRIILVFQSIVCAHLRRLHFILYLEASIFNPHFVESGQKARERARERGKREREHIVNRHTKYTFYLYTRTATKGIRCAIGAHTKPIRVYMDENNTDIIIHLITYISDTVCYYRTRKLNSTMVSRWEQLIQWHASPDLLAYLLLATARRTSTLQFDLAASQRERQKTQSSIFWQIFFRSYHIESYSQRYSVSWSTWTFRLLMMIEQ